MTTPMAAIKAATLDLFPYMEAYTAALWCLATVSTRNRSTRTKNLARILATLPICFDVVETLILRQTCLSEVSDRVVVVASIANQFKWVFFVGFLAIYLPLWFVNSCVSDNTKGDWDRVPIVQLGRGELSKTIVDSSYDIRVILWIGERIEKAKKKTGKKAVSNDVIRFDDRTGWRRRCSTNNIVVASPVVQDQTTSISHHGMLDRDWIHRSVLTETYEWPFMKNSIRQ